MPANIHWTEQEVEILKTCIGKMPVRQIRAQFLPNRTAKAISRKIDALKTPEQRAASAVNPAWTKDDLKYLRENFEHMDYADLAKHFGRSQIAVRNKVDQLRLKRKLLKPGSQGIQRPWTDDELQILRENAGKITATEIYHTYMPYRSLYGIRAQIRRQGLAGPTPRPWTDQEQQIVEAHADQPMAEWMHLLPGRTKDAVHNRVAALRTNSKLE